MIEGLSSVKRALHENGSESNAEHRSIVQRCRYVGDSQISCRVIDARSALRRADPCSALDCEPTNGSGSRIFCPAVKAMSAATQRPTGCPTKHFFPGTAR